MAGKNNYQIYTQVNFRLTGVDESVSRAKSRIRELTDTLQGAQEKLKQAKTELKSKTTSVDRKNELESTTIPELQNKIKGYQGELKTLKQLVNDNVRAYNVLKKTIEATDGMTPKAAEYLRANLPKVLKSINDLGAGAQEKIRGIAEVLRISEGELKKFAAGVANVAKPFDKNRGETLGESKAYVHLFETLGRAAVKTDEEYQIFAKHAAESMKNIGRQEGVIQGTTNAQREYINSLKATIEFEEKLQAKTKGNSAADRETRIMSAQRERSAQEALGGVYAEQLTKSNRNALSVGGMQEASQGAQAWLDATKRHDAEMQEEYQKYKNFTDSFFTDENGKMHNYVLTNKKEYEKALEDQANYNTTEQQLLRQERQQRIDNANATISKYEEQQEKLRRGENVAADSRISDGEYQRQVQILNDEKQAMDAGTAAYERRVAVIHSYRTQMAQGLDQGRGEQLQAWNASYNDKDATKKRNSEQARMQNDIDETIARLGTVGTTIDRLSDDERTKLAEARANLVTTESEITSLNTKLQGLIATNRDLREANDQQLKTEIAAATTDAQRAEARKRWAEEDKRINEASAIAIDNVNTALREQNLIREKALRDVTELSAKQNTAVMTEEGSKQMLGYKEGTKKIGGVDTEVFTTNRLNKLDDSALKDIKALWTDIVRDLKSSGSLTDEENKKLAVGEEIIRRIKDQQAQRVLTGRRTIDQLEEEYRVLQKSSETALLAGSKGRGTITQNNKDVKDNVVSSLQTILQNAGKFSEEELQKAVRLSKEILSTDILRKDEQNALNESIRKGNQELAKRTDKTTTSGYLGQLGAKKTDIDRYFGDSGKSIDVATMKLKEMKKISDPLLQQMIRGMEGVINHAKDMGNEYKNDTLFLQRLHNEQERRIKETLSTSNDSTQLRTAIEDAKKLRDSYFDATKPLDNQSVKWQEMDVLIRHAMGTLQKMGQAVTLEDANKKMEGAFANIASIGDESLKKIIGDVQRMRSELQETGQWTTKLENDFKNLQAVQSQRGKDKLDTSYNNIMASGKGSTEFIQSIINGYKQLSIEWQKNGKDATELENKIKDLNAQLAANRNGDVMARFANIGNMSREGLQSLLNDFKAMRTELENNAKYTGQYETEIKTLEGALRNTSFKERTEDLQQMYANVKNLSDEGLTSLINKYRALCEEMEAAHQPTTQLRNDLLDMQKIQGERKIGNATDIIQNGDYAKTSLTLKEMQEMMSKLKAYRDTLSLDTATDPLGMNKTNEAIAVLQGNMDKLVDKTRQTKQEMTVGEAWDVLSKPLVHSTEEVNKAMKVMEDTARATYSNMGNDMTKADTIFDDGSRKIVKSAEDIKSRMQEVKDVMDKFATDSKKPMMEEQYNSGLKDLSDKALQEQLKYWEEMIKAERNAAGGVQDYKDKVDALQKQIRSNSEKDMSNMLGKTYTAGTLKADDLKNLNASQVKEMQQNIQNLLSATNTGDDAAIKNLNADLKVTGEQLKKLQKDWMSTADAHTMYASISNKDALNSTGLTYTIENLERAKKALEEYGHTKLDASSQAYKDNAKEVRALSDEIKRLKAEETSKKSGGGTAIIDPEKLKAIKTAAGQSSAALRELFDTGKYKIKEDDGTGKLITKLKHVDLSAKDVQLAMKAWREEAVNDANMTSDAMAKVGLAIGRVDQLQKELTDTTKSHTSTLANAIDRLKNYVLIYVGFQQVADQVIGELKQNFALTDEMANIQKVTKLSTDEVGNLSNALADLDSRTSHSTLMQLAFQGGKMGIGSNGDMNGLASFVETANKLNMSLGEDFGGTAAIGSLAKLNQVMKVQEKEHVTLNEALEKTGSAILQLGNNSIASYTKISQFAQRMGGIAMSAKMTMPQLLALGSTLDTFGAQSEMAATAITKFISQMIKQPEVVARAVGASEEEMQKLIWNGQTMDAMQLVFDSLKRNGADLETIAGRLKDLVGGGNNTRALQVLTEMANGADTLREHLKMSQQAFDENVNVEDEYTRMNQTAAASVERIGNAIHEAFANDTTANWFNSTFKWIADSISGIENLKTAFGLFVVWAWTMIKMYASRSWTLLSSHPIMIMNAWRKAIFNMGTWLNGLKALAGGVGKALLGGLMGIGIGLLLEGVYKGISKIYDMMGKTRNRANEIAKGISDMIDTDMNKLKNEITKTNAELNKLGKTGNFSGLNSGLAEGIDKTKQATETLRTYRKEVEDTGKTSEEAAKKNAEANKKAADAWMTAVGSVTGSIPVMAQGMDVNTNVRQLIEEADNHKLLAEAVRQQMEAEKTEIETSINARVEQYESVKALEARLEAQKKLTEEAAKQRDKYVPAADAAATRMINKLNPASPTPEEDQEALFQSEKYKKLEAIWVKYGGEYTKQVTAQFKIEHELAKERKRIYDELDKQRPKKVTEQNYLVDALQKQQQAAAFGINRAFRDNTMALNEEIEKQKAAMDQLAEHTKQKSQEGGDAVSAAAQGAIDALTGTQPAMAASTDAQTKAAEVTKQHTDSIAQNTDSVRNNRAATDEHTDSINEKADATNEAAKAKENETEQTEAGTKAEGKNAEAEHNAEMQKRATKEQIDYINQNYSTYLGFLVSETARQYDLADAISLVTARRKEDALMKAMGDASDKGDELYGNDISTAKQGVLELINGKFKAGTDRNRIMGQFETWVANMVKKNPNFQLDLNNHELAQFIKGNVAGVVTKGANGKQQVNQDKLEEMLRFFNKGDFKDYVEKVGERQEYVGGIQKVVKSELDYEQQKIRSGVKKELDKLNADVAAAQKALDAAKKNPTTDADVKEASSNLVRALNARKQYAEANAERFKGTDNDMYNQLMGVVGANGVRKGGQIASDENAIYDTRKNAGFLKYQNIMTMMGDEIVEGQRAMLKNWRKVTHSDKSQKYVDEYSKQVGEQFKSFEEAQTWTEARLSEYRKRADELDITIEGAWKSDKNKKGSKKNDVDSESEAAIAELDRYYETQKTVYEGWLNKEKITKEQYDQLMDQNEAEHLKKRQQLRSTFTKKIYDASTDTLKDMNQQDIEAFRKWWKQMIAEGKLDEINWTKVETEWARKTGKGNDVVNWNTNLDKREKKNNFEAQKDLTANEKIYSEHVAKINKILEDDNPFLKLFDDTRAAMFDLGALVTSSEAGTIDEAKGLIEKRTAFLMDWVNNAYTKDVKGLVADIKAAAKNDPDMNVWAALLEQDPDLANAVVIKTRNLYEQIQDAVKKEAKNMQQNVDYFYNLEGDDGKSLKERYEEQTAAIERTQHAVESYNNAYNSGYYSQKKSDNLALAALKSKLKMQQDYLDLLKTEGQRRIAIAKAAVEEAKAKGEDTSIKQHQLEVEEKAYGQLVKEQNKTILDTQNTISDKLDDMNTKMIKYVKSWGDYFSKSMTSVMSAMAENITGVENYTNSNYDQLAINRLQGTGSDTSSRYIIVQNSGKEDASASYQYMTENEKLQWEIDEDKRQKEQEYRAEAWQNLIDAFGEQFNNTVNDMITSWGDNLVQQQLVTAEDNNTNMLKTANESLQQAITALNNNSSSHSNIGSVGSSAGVTNNYYGGDENHTYGNGKSPYTLDNVDVTPNSNQVVTDENRDASIANLQAIRDELNNGAYPEFMKPGSQEFDANSSGTVISEQNKNTTIANAQAIRDELSTGNYPDFMKPGSQEGDALGLTHSLISSDTVKETVSNATTMGNAVTDTEKSIAKTDTKTQTQMQSGSNSTLQTWLQACNLYSAAYSAMSNSNLSADQKWQLFAVQAAGQAAMAGLSASLSKATGKAAEGVSEGTSAAWASGNPVTAAIIVALVTAAIGAALGYATSKITQSKSEVASITGVSNNASAGKLATGMLTYAKGKLPVFDEGTEGSGKSNSSGNNSVSGGARYVVSGSDGADYSAKFEKELQTKKYSGGAHFGIFSEKKPEIVIGGDDTATILSQYPYLYDGILAVHRGQDPRLTMDYGYIQQRMESLSKVQKMSLAKSAFGKMPTFAEGNIEDIEGLTPSISQGEEAGVSTSVSGGGANISSTLVLMNQMLSTLIEEGVTAGVEITGKHGLDKQTAKYNRWKKRNGLA